jgi:transcriptional pleiotropic repressor
MNLLAKTRRINSRLQKTAGHTVDFNEIAEVLSEVIDANIFVVSPTGDLLGLMIAEPIDNKRVMLMIEERLFPAEYSSQLLEQDNTIFNIGIDNPLTSFPEEMKEVFGNSYTALIPIVGGGLRVGTLIIGRLNQPFTDDDLVLGEYSATVIGMEILRVKSELIEREIRDNAVIDIAIKSLSYSELEAVQHIFEHLTNKEGLIVASKIADNVGITRSVIVNALRKLESAGVIETRSLGMKGTYIRVNNDKLFAELKRYNYHK